LPRNKDNATGGRHWHVLRWSKPVTHAQSRCSSLPAGAADCAWHGRHANAPVPLDQVSVMHVAHAAGPTPPLYCPAAHATHLPGAPFGAVASWNCQNEPALHTQSETTTLASRACELRTGHAWHAVWLGSGLNAPGAHSLHAPLGVVA